MGRDPAGHIADRAQTQHGQRAALRDFGIRDRLPRSGQHVGQVHEPFVRRSFGHLDVSELRLRDPEIFRLAASNLPVKLGVTEQCGTGSVLPHLGGLALRVQLLLAHEAVPARHLERNDNPVADGDRVDLGANLKDDAHRLVTKDVPFPHERTKGFVQMQVGSADVGACDADNCVGGLLDPGIGDIADPDVALAVPSHCLHRFSIGPRQLRRNSSRLR